METAPVTGLDERGVPLHPPAEGHISAGPIPRAVGGSLARAQPQAGEMNGSNPGPHFILSQAIAKFCQALRSKSRIWHQLHKSWGPSTATSASPSPTKSHQLVLLSVAEQQNHQQSLPRTAQDASSDQGLLRGILEFLSFCILQHLPKTMFPSSMKVCLHSDPIEAFHKNKKLTNTTGKKVLKTIVLSQNWAGKTPTDRSQLVS